MQSVQNETIYEMRLTTEELLELASGDTLRSEAVVEAARDGLPIAGEGESWLARRGITVHAITLTASEVAELAEGDLERIYAISESAQDIADMEGLEWRSD